MHAGEEVVWTRRFDRAAADILALQDELASATAAQIAPELMLRQSAQAAARRRADPTSHELMLRAIPAIYRIDQEGFRAAGQMLEESLRLDPSFAPAHSWLAHWHIFLLGQGWAEDPDAASRRAGELSERAVMLDPGDARGLTLAGHVRGYLHHQPGEGMALHERALAINPNLALAWSLAGLTQSYLGEHREAIRCNEEAQRLSPYDPHGFFFETARIMPHLLLHEHDVAAEVGRRAVELNPGFSSGYKGLLAALGHLGRAAETPSLRARLLALEPGFTIEGAISRSPLTQPQDLAHYAEGLRRAGLPEGEGAKAGASGGSRPRAAGASPDTGSSSRAPAR